MYTEPEQNVFNFTGGDYILDLAEKHGMRVRCHNLVWSLDCRNFDCSYEEPHPDFD
jgi:GH35 family endo-1,4-beta-xylanase